MSGRRSRKSLAFALLLPAVLAAGAMALTAFRGDYDGDGIVETDDLFDFARAYRSRQDPASGRAADLNADGRVNEFDIFIFLRDWNEDRDRALGE